MNSVNNLVIGGDFIQHSYSLSVECTKIHIVPCGPNWKDIILNVVNGLIQEDAILKKRLYPKKRLKYEESIKREKIIIFILEFKIIVMSLKGKKPPEDIKLIDRLNESKVLKLIIFKIIKINSVIKL